MRPRKLKPRDQRARVTCKRCGFNYDPSLFCNEDGSGRYCPNCAILRGFAEEEAAKAEAERIAGEIMAEEGGDE